MCNQAKILQNPLSQSSKVAFRKGNLLFKGWVLKKDANRDIINRGRPIADNDLRPDLQQKGVNEVGRYGIHRAIQDPPGVRWGDRTLWARVGYGFYWDRIDT